MYNLNSFCTELMYICNNKTGAVVLRRGVGLHPAGRVRGPGVAARLRAGRRPQQVALGRV